MNTRTPPLDDKKRDRIGVLSRLRRWIVWLPVLFFLALIGYLHAPRAEVSILPQLLPVLNLVFFILAPLAAAAVAAGIHLTGGHSAFLPAGAGLLAVSLAGLLSTLQFQSHHFAADSILGFLGCALAGACSLWAVMRLFRPAPRPTRPAWTTLLAGYGAVFLGLSVSGWAVYARVLPTFFIKAWDSTSLRQAVAGVTIGELFLSALGVLIVHHRRRLTFLPGCALGLALTAVGLLALLGIGADPAGRLAITGRGALYLGMLYLLVSVSLAARQSGRWSIPLETLWETHQWYTRLVDTHPDAILVSSTGRCLFANPAAVRLFGASAPQELVGWPVLELVHPESRPLVEAYLREAFHPQRFDLPRELRLQQLDGRPREAELIAVRVEYKGGSAVQMVLRDLHLHRQAEAEIRSLAGFPAENPNPVFRFTGGGRPIYANPAGRPMLDAWEAAGAAGLPAHLTGILPEVLAAASPREVEERIGERWYLLTFIPVPEAGFVNLYARDITRSRQAEQALRESREDLNHAQAVAHIGSWRLELAGSELLWSDECHRIFGVPQGTRMTYQLFLDRVHPEDRALVDRKWSAALQGEPYDIEHRILVGGAVKWVREQAELEFGADGKLCSGFGTAQDITGQKRADAALRAVKEQLEEEITDVNILHRLSAHYIEGGQLPSLLHEVMEAAITITRTSKGNLQLFDPQTQELRIAAHKGLTPAFLAFFATVPAGESTACSAALQRLERTVVEDITRSPIFRDSAALRLLLDEEIRAVQSTPLVSRAGRVLGMISTHFTRVHVPAERELRFLDILARQAADILERKQAEEALQQLNRSLDEKVAERTAEVMEKARQLRVLAVQLTEAEERERKRIATLLHDDLQQVLASVRLRLQAGWQGLAEDFPLAPILRGADRLLEEALQKARRLTHDLSPPILHHAGLEASLKWLCGRMREQYGLQVVLEADGWQDGAAEPMKLFLFRAAQELLFNVVKHAGTGCACLRLSMEEGRLIVTVSDSGSGIDPRVLDSPGSGYGLFSIRERAEAAGGSLQVEGAPGAGSRLRLAIPGGSRRAGAAGETATAERSAPVLVAPAPVSRPRAACRVLLADDHRVMREGLVAMIRGQPDIEVVGEAANGREALELARRLVPDVVVMDVSMPGMDGIEATRRIKAEMPGVRIIGLSMFEEEEVAQAMRAAGAEAFVSKTDSSGRLLRAIYAIGDPAGAGSGG